MLGTAPQAQLWIAIEQWGPYGHKALTESRFPREVGERLPAAIGSLPIKVVLVRPAGPHALRRGNPEPHLQRTRRMWVARSTPGHVAMVSTTIADPRELLGLDLAALLDSELDDVVPASTAESAPLLLICTNGKRDACCAQLARPVADSLGTQERWRDRVWESSHLGGHRFAPTGLQLPHGWVHGRMDPENAAALMTAADAGAVDLTRVRGRSSLSPAAQVADVVVRSTYRISGLDATSVTAGADETEWVVSSATRSYLQRVEATTGPARTESCGAVAQLWKGFEAVNAPRER
ncbi:MAG: sucrase ferredoxin [Actinomycetes bacterium]